MVKCIILKMKKVIVLEMKKKHKIRKVINFKLSLGRRENYLY